MIDDDLSTKVAIIIGEREVTYANFSRHIAHVRDLLEQESKGESILGLSLSLTNYQHWVAHFAAATLGIATVAMRPDQETYTDIPVIGPVDPMADTRIIPLDHLVLSEAPPERIALLAYREASQALAENEECLHRIVLTSGSTGTAKDVLLCNRDIKRRQQVNEHFWERHLPEKKGNRRVLCLMGRDTLAGFQLALFGLLNGESIIFLAPGPALESLLRGVEQANHVAGTPALFITLCDAANRTPLVNVNTRSIVSAGTRLELPVRDRIKELLGARVFSVYGSTETGFVADYDMTNYEGDSSYAGRLCHGVDLQICSDNDEPLAPMIEGRIRVRTEEMTDGYGRNTSEGAFYDGWFYPGDRGYITSEKDLYVVGRDDDLLNINGEKLLATHVESKLIETGQFTDVCVLPYLRSDGRDLLVVMTVSGLEKEKQRSIVTPLIPFVSFKILPVETIPRNHMGKIERKALTEYLRENLVEDSMLENSGHDA